MDQPLPSLETTQIPTAKPKPWRTLMIAGVGLLLVGIGFVVGNNYSIDLSQPLHPLVARSSQSPLNDPLYQQVQSLMESKYLSKSDLDQKKMVYGAIAGMVSSAGDPYTSFFDPAQNKDAESQLSGTYEGIGAQLGFKDKQIVIVAPLKDSPAMAAGVRAGDALLKIDDKDTTGMSLGEAVNLIRGKADTSVKLVILRDGEEKSRTLDITRKQITINSVDLSYKDNPATAETDTDVAVVKINRFGDTTNKEWDDAVKALKAKGAKQLVVDLRDNPGGYLDSAIHIGSEFFNDGVIVGQQGSDGKIQNFEVDRVGQLTTMPTVVLVNKGSASASEIVSGALQSRDRAVVVGENSFGKGSVQQVIDLSQGTSLHVTIAKWLMPNGQNIDKVGIKPQIEVALTEEDIAQSKDPQLDTAVVTVTKSQ